MATMRFAIYLVALLGLVPYPAAAEPADDSLGCAALAERKAARQYAEDTAMLKDRQAGGFRDSALRRDLLRLDAESYRARIYRECLRQRSRPDTTPPAPPAAD